MESILKYQGILEEAINTKSRDVNSILNTIKLMEQKIRDVLDINLSFSNYMKGLK